MNLGIWSMPGIDVTDINGRVLVFQNVVKRDDAFRKLGMFVKCSNWRARSSFVSVVLCSSTYKTSLIVFHGIVVTSGKKWSHVN